MDRIEQQEQIEMSRIEKDWREKLMWKMKEITYAKLLSPQI